VSVEVFGRLIDEGDLEEAVETTVQLWLPTYLAEVERQKGLAPQTLSLPRSYSTVNEFYKWEEDNLPGIIVVSPGTSPKPPVKEGNGSYRSWYRVGVAVVASGKNRDETRLITKLYSTALLASVMQHQDLGGDLGVEGIAWTGKRNSDVPDEQGRTLGSGQVTFDVEIRDVLNPRLGMLEPAADPYDDPDWPTADDPIGVAVELKED